MLRRGRRSPTGDATTPTTPLALAERGQAHHDAGHLVEAEASYRAALMGRTPGISDDWILSNLALLLAQTDRRDEAEQVLHTGLAVSPTHEGLLRVLGQILCETGRQEEAEPILRRAVEARDPRPESFLLLGNILMQTGRTGQAELVWRDGRARHPDHVALIQMLALSQIRLGRLTEAEEIVRTGLLRVPGSGALLAEQAALRHYAGDHQGAVDGLRAEPAASAVDGVRRLVLGRALARLGRHDEAATEMVRAVQDGLDRPGLLFEVGVELLVLPPAPDAAEPLLRRASELAPGPDAGHAHAAALHLLGRHDEADDAERHAIALEHQPVHPVTAAGLWHIAHDLDRVLASVDRADAADPTGTTEAQRTVLRAVALEELGRLDEAEAAHAAARAASDRSTPASVVADANVVRFLLRRGRLGEAAGLAGAVIGRLAPAELREVVLEVVAYALAVDAGRSDAELFGRLRDALRSGARSPTWDLSPAIEAARARGEDRVALVAAVAEVVGGRAAPSSLDPFGATEG